MATQQQLEQELQGLLQACQAAPRYGANGRFLILQTARHIEEYEAEHGVEAVAWPPPGVHDPSAAAAGSAATPAPADTTFTSNLSASQALELLPPKERPFVAFVPRSFLTQAVRQQVVNRLTGAFLVTLVEALQLPAQQHSQVISSSPLLRKAAAAAALEVEKGLYRRITSPAAYHQQAPSLQAEVSLVPPDTWQQLVQELAPQLLPTLAAAQPVVDHNPHPQQQQQQQQQQRRQQQQQQHRQLQQPKQQQASQVGPPHDECQADSPVPANTTSSPSGAPPLASAAETAAIQQQQDGQPDGIDQLFEDQGEEEGNGADAQGDEEGEGRGEQEEAGAVAHEENAPGGPSRLSNRGQQQQEQGEAAGHVSRKRPAVGNPGEGPPQQQQQQDARPGAGAVPSAVREQVLAHVLALLQPAVASGRLPPAQLARVATRASDKVCAAHAGASDAGFLAQHSGSVARLVDKLLAHYAGLPPQQAPD